MSGQVIHKSVAGASQVVSETPDAGLIRAFVNSTGVVDRQSDKVTVGAWGRVIKDFTNGAAKVAVAVNHEYGAGSIVGKVIRLEELRPSDPRLSANHLTAGAGALMADMQFALKTQAGRDAFQLCKGGYLDSWSVGFLLSQKAPKMVRDSKSGESYRELSDIETLLEVSSVLVGASPFTSTLEAKAWRKGQRRNIEEEESWEAIEAVVATRLRRMNATWRRTSYKGSIALGPVSAAMAELLTRRS